MKKDQCYFHRNAIAQTKCPQCGKKICLDCAQKKGLCPICHQKNVELSYGPTMGIFMGIFAIFCLIMGIVTATIDEFGFVMLIFGLIVFGLVGFLLYYVYVKSAPREKEKARKILEQAQQALENSKDLIIIDKEDNGIQKLNLTCKFCGAPTKAGDTTCSYCGMNWVYRNP